MCLGLLLIGLVFYSGTAASPYVDTFDNNYNNQIIDTDTEIQTLGVDADGNHGNPYFGLTTGHPQLNDDGTVNTKAVDVYQHAELAPTTREIFDRARTAEDQAFEPTLCKEWVLICDEYRQSDVPDEFTYGAVGHDISQTSLYVIEVENQAYLLRTGAPTHGDNIPLAKAVAFLFNRLMLVLIAASILYYVVRPPESDSVYSFDIGLGISMGALALLAPYLHMVGIEVDIVWRIIALTPVIALVYFILNKLEKQ